MTKYHGDAGDLLKRLRDDDDLTSRTEAADYIEALEAAITVLEGEAERMVEELRKPFLTVFLDGRNEHGSHVIPCGAENVGVGFQEIQSLLESQEDGIAERIILEAEGAGYEVTQCVVTEWSFEKADGSWDYASLNIPLTVVFCGSADEQLNAHDQGKP